MKEILGNFGDICRMIKIEHSVFALPYAWAGAFLAQRGLPGWRILFFLTTAMIAARSFAMTFNRIADLKIDIQNPRTCKRPLCTGAITMRQAYFFCFVMAILFIISCACLNFTCLLLSLPALIFSAIYSFLKRVSSISHFWLGATLGLAPVAGWLSVNGFFLGLPAILLCLAVTFWVGAFDIYYAFQDIEFDKTHNLYSIPSRFGAAAALALAGFSHAITIIFLFLTGLAAQLGWPWYVLCGFVAILLAWEHRLVKPDDLSRVNTAFFTLNGIISPLVLAGVILGIYF